MEQRICTSCGRKSLNYVKFGCVNCGNEIIRCANCRARGLEYVCPKCNMHGP